MNNLSTPQPLLLTDGSFHKPIRIVPMKEPVMVRADWSIQKVIGKMKTRHSGGALVSTAEGELLGVFTERDLLLRVMGKSWDLETQPISDVMTPHPVCMHASESVGAALNLMFIQGFRHIPIVTESGHPQALLSMREILEYLADHLQDDQFSQTNKPDTALLENLQSADSL